MPIGIILGLFKKQFLDLNWNKEDSSYWNYNSNIYQSNNYDKQF